MKVLYPPLLSSNMSAVALKLSESLKKEHGFLFFSLERKTTFWGGSQFYVEIREREVADLTPKGP